jgi:hypothetical protein
MWELWNNGNRDMNVEIATWNCGNRNMELGKSQHGITEIATWNQGNRIMNVEIATWNYRNRIIFQYLI